MSPGDGILLYDKPPGITSHDVVAAVRRSLGGRRVAKVGHAGTLDPFATGLLLVLVGRATRVQRFLMELPKTYVVTARFGFVSSTGDPEGSLVETGVVPSGDLLLPVGMLRQRPPAYSAVKIGGRRAYALARAGEEVEMPERSVSVYRFVETFRSDGGAVRSFEIDCSSGTYVRSLIADLGDAYCTALRRTAIGRFSVDDADPSRLVPLGEALDFLPAVVLGPDEAARAAHGARVAVGAAHGGPAGPPPGALPGAPAASAGTVRLIDADGLIALGSLDPDTATVKPIVGFRG